MVTDTYQLKPLQASLPGTVIEELTRKLAYMKAGKPLQPVHMIPLTDKCIRIRRPGKEQRLTADQDGRQAVRRHPANRTRCYDNIDLIFR